MREADQGRPHQGRYRLVGRGGDLVIDVEGPDLMACLRAAVAGFAASIADVPAATVAAAVDLHVEGGSPEALLVNLLDEAIVLLDAGGQLTVGVDGRVDAAGSLWATLRVVDLGAVEVHGEPPKAATWHDVDLRQEGDRWSGRIMLDL